MKKLSLFLIIMIAAWLPNAEAGVITSAGSTTVQPAMKACSKAYKKTHTGMQFIIAGGGSSKGVKSIARGKVDIGRASRALKSKEVKAYPDIKPIKIGTDGVAIVVNAANPLSKITSNQVEQIFKGAINQWRALGGSGKIALISLGTEHGTYELFSKKFHLKAMEKDGELVFDKGHAWIAFSQDVGLKKVEQNVSSITFASIGVAEEYAKHHHVKLLTLDGVAPTTSNVANGNYKLSRPLLLITKGEPTGEVKGFVDYMQASECQSIIKNLGYVPVH